MKGLTWIPLDWARGLVRVGVQSAIAVAHKRLDGRGRLVVRPSGTEPVIRVMAEGDDKLLVEEVVDGVVEALAQAAA